MTTSDFTQVRRLLADRYDLERELGRGGMGAVFLARDRTLDRPVALKILPEEFAADPALHERFLREMKTTASFSHPNIVPVHAVEERPGVVAYAMGFVEGESLAQRVQRAGPLTVRELVRLLQDIGYALAYAHGRGVAHRDLKPDNIMLERATGRALLMDFGIARAITEPAGGGGLTRVGEVVGTPEYMSPEQAAGDTVDGRSDLYSLGLVAWFAATGRPAVSGESVQKILVKQLTETLPSIESVRPELPDLLSAAIDRCIAKNPEDRYQTAESLVEAVDNSQLAGPDIPLPVRIFTGDLGTMSLIVVFITLVAWYAIRSSVARAAALQALLPVVILFAVGFTRLLQTLSDARRLLAAGFTRDDVLRGMRDVMDERESLRAALRGDPATRRRRRLTVWVALLQLAGAVVLTWLGLRQRTQVGPTHYQVPPGSLVLLIVALAWVAISLVLLARSPLRMPVGERAFRRLWLGPLGRAFLTVAGRGIAVGRGVPVTPLAAFSRSVPAPGPSSDTGPGRAPGRALRPPEASSATPGTSTGAGGASVADDVVGAVERLEARVTQLEEWRRRTAE
ncbi:MAG TPA: serine/threonine-protein kinase [Gemmatimonadaceae bacterium]|nr:serine/threonine-protein kinase [Gemmatimonadaceae bacterium]